MKYKFFTDLHWYGPHELKIDLEDGDDCYYLGDNIDLRCCLKKNVPWAQYWLRHFQKEFKDRYILGNHELAQADNDFIAVNGILMTHGDYLFWNKKKADSYRAQKPGMNIFHYWYIKIMFGYLFQLITWPVLKSVKERAVQLAKHFNCHTVVCGHWHPRKIVDIKYKGIRLVVLPRGKTELDL